MIMNAKNEHLFLETGEMDYIRFGKGEQALVMLPGVGDGLKTVKGMAAPFAFLYRSLAKEFTVYVFSRRVPLPEHMTTREMAEDLNSAMEILGLRKTAVVGVSQGGMIAQWLAVDHADKAEKLVLTVTMSRPNDTIRAVVRGWTEMAKHGDYRGIMLDTAKRSYSATRLKAAQLEAESCITHDCYAQLDRIVCPTLVIGGTDDRIVTGEASIELANGIPDSRLRMYEGLGHGLYEEAPDFLQQVKAFCLPKNGFCEQQG